MVCPGDHKNYYSMILIMESVPQLRCANVCCGGHGNNVNGTEIKLTMSEGSAYQKLPPLDQSCRSSEYSSMYSAVQGFII